MSRYLRFLLLLTGLTALSFTQLQAQWDWNVTTEVQLKTGLFVTLEVADPGTNVEAFGPSQFTFDVDQAVVDPTTFVLENPGRWSNASGNTDYAVDPNPLTTPDPTNGYIQYRLTPSPSVTEPTPATSDIDAAGGGESDTVVTFSLELINCDNSTSPVVLDTNYAPLPGATVVEWRTGSPYDFESINDEGTGTDGSFVANPLGPVTITDNGNLFCNNDTIRLGVQHDLTGANLTEINYSFYFDVSADGDITGSDTIILDTLGNSLANDQTVITDTAGFIASAITDGTVLVETAYDNGASCQISDTSASVAFTLQAVPVLPLLPDTALCTGEELVVDAIGADDSISYIIAPTLNAAGITFGPGDNGGLIEAQDTSFIFVNGLAPGTLSEDTIKYTFHTTAGCISQDEQIVYVAPRLDITNNAPGDIVELCYEETIDISDGGTNALDFTTAGNVFATTTPPVGDVTLGADISIQAPGAAATYAFSVSGSNILSDEQIGILDIATKTELVDSFTLFDAVAPENDSLNVVYTIIDSLYSDKFCTYTDTVELAGRPTIEWANAAGPGSVADSVDINTLAACGTGLADLNEPGGPSWYLAGGTNQATVTGPTAVAWESITGTGDLFTASGATTLGPVAPGVEEEPEVDILAVSPNPREFAITVTDDAGCQYIGVAAVDVAGSITYADAELFLEAAMNTASATPAMNPAPTSLQNALDGFTAASPVVDPDSTAARENAVVGTPGTHFYGANLKMEPGAAIPANVVDLIRFDFFTDVTFGTPVNTEPAYGWLLDDGSVVDFERPDSLGFRVCGLTLGTDYVMVARHKSHTSLVSVNPASVQSYSDATTADANTYDYSVFGNLYEEPTVLTTGSNNIEEGSATPLWNVEAAISGNVYNAPWETYESVNAMDYFYTLLASSLGATVRFSQFDTNVDGDENATDVTIIEENVNNILPSAFQPN